MNNAMDLNLLIYRKKVKIPKDLMIFLRHGMTLVAYWVVTNICLRRTVCCIRIRLTHTLMRKPPFYFPHP